MRGRRLRAYDRRLHAWVGGLPLSPADRWLRRLSHSADHGKLWFAFALLLAVRGGRLRRAAIRGVAAQGMTSLLTNALLKRIVGRVRPDMANLRTERALRRAPGTLSFPSGHSSSAAAFVTGVAVEAPLVGAALAPVALGVGYSRVHAGVHYPGDVLAGLALGAGLALAGRRLAPPAPREIPRSRAREGSSTATSRDLAAEGIAAEAGPRAAPPGALPA